MRYFEKIAISAQVVNKAILKRMDLLEKTKGTASVPLANKTIDQLENLLNISKGIADKNTKKLLKGVRNTGEILETGAVVDKKQNIIKGLKNFYNRMP